MNQAGHYVLSTLGRFWAPQAADALAAKGLQVDLHMRDLKGSVHSSAVQIHRGGLVGIVDALLLKATRNSGVERSIVERFDRTVASWLARVPSQRFHGLSLFCEKSLEAARRTGVPTAVERSGAHIIEQLRLYEEERARLGLPLDNPKDFYHSAAGIDRMRREYEIADRIVVSSSFVRDSFLKAGFPSSRLDVVPLGANFTPAAWTPKPPAFSVLTAGNDAIRKGMVDVLDAFSLAGLDDATLYFRSPAPPYLTDRLRALGERVVLLPPMEHRLLRRYFETATVFCLLSIEDGFGMVVGEAMSLGCPVVVTKNVGASDMVTEGVDGFVVDIRRPEKVAERLVKLHDDPELLRSMSKAAVRKAAEFGWDRYATELLETWMSGSSAGRKDHGAPR